MDDIERSSPVQIIQPVRKIRAYIFNRERRELMNPFKRNQLRQANKRKKPGIRRTEYLTEEGETTTTIEQDLIDYKSDLKTRLTFDRALILHEEPCSD
jgi:hypothetical protein